MLWREILQKLGIGNKYYFQDWKYVKHILRMWGVYFLWIVNVFIGWQTIKWCQL